MNRQATHRAPWFWVAGLLLVAVASAAVTPLRADFSARTVMAQGSAGMSGPLVLFFQEHTNREIGGAAPNFHLDAEKLRVETDAASPFVNAGVVGVTPLEKTETRDYGHAVVDGVSNGPYYRFNVFSTDVTQPARVEVNTGCANAATPAIPSIRRTPLVNSNRLGTAREVHQTIDWTCLDNAWVKIQGDFWLSLWVWNATLTAGGSTQTLQSGHQEWSALPPGAPERSQAVSQAQELYLYASNAALTVPYLTGQGYTLFTGPETTLLATDLSASGTEGLLSYADHALSLDGNALRIAGQSHTVLTGTDVDQPFKAQLTATPDEITVDGKILSMAATPKAPISLNYIEFLVGFLLAFAALVTVTRYLQRPHRAFQRAHDTGRPYCLSPPKSRRQQQGTGYILLAQDALLEGHWKKALRLANKGIRRYPESLDALELQAMAHYKLGDYPRTVQCARQALATMHPGPERAQLEIVAAMAHIHLNQIGPAIEMMQAASQDDPHAFAASANDRIFDVLLDHPWFRNIRGLWPDPSIA